MRTPEWTRRPPSGLDFRVSDWTMRLFDVWGSRVEDFTMFSKSGVEVDRRIRGRRFPKFPNS